MYFLLSLLLAISGLAAEPERVLFDFESGTFDGWVVEGANPFGNAPFRAAAQVPKWRADRNFSGWQGNYMVIAGDTRHAQVPRGRITSPEFLITHPYLKFRFGGEAHPHVRVSLMVGGREVRTAFGNNSYEMRLRGWEIAEFRGQRARVVIEDTADVPSLMRLDYFHLSHSPPPPIGAFDESPQESDLLRYGELKLILEAGSGEFIAHATITRGFDKRWHIYAQIAPLADRDKPANHKTIWHATAANPMGPWSKLQPVMTADSSVGESFLWQPFVMTHDGRYWMFYVGSGVPWKGWDRKNNWRAKDFGKESTQGPYGIHLATSRDGATWTRHSNLPLFTDSPFAFTPFVIPVERGWAMYYAAAEPPTVMGKHAIVTRTSSDLIKWTDRRVALRDVSDTTPWPEHSFFHSPVVFRRDRFWYLLAGPIDNHNQARFHYRKLFRSNDPFRFDVTRDLKGLFVEGAANLVRGESGGLFITHTGPYAGGVWMAPLLWNDRSGSPRKSPVNAGDR